jgi:hypothetical protein
MGGGSVLWAETPDEEGDEADQVERPGEVDESFAARRLRRWIRGMFGGKPVEEPRGNREVPPASEDLAREPCGDDR